MTEIFVFGSNLSGIHGAGAAKFAYLYKGAIWGKAYGLMGHSFAIPTKDAAIRHTLPLERIRWYVNDFKEYVKQYPEYSFQVTRIGCGLAGLKDEDVAPFFIGSPDNCYFDSKWEPILGKDYKYWGNY